MLNIRFLLLGLLLLVGSCQSPTIHEDYNPQKDYSHYHSWRWHASPLKFRPADDPRIQGDLTEQRIRQAVEQQLLQQGLTQTTPADLQVQVWVLVDVRQEQIVSQRSWWPGWGHWGHGAQLESRVEDFRTRTLQIDFYDSQTDKLVWRGRRTQRLTEQPLSPEQRQQQLQQLVRDIISHYPPR